VCGTCLSSSDLSYDDSSFAKTGSGQAQGNLKRRGVSTGPPCDDGVVDSCFSIKSFICVGPEPVLTN
jgi:hypothetical protein